MSTVKKSSLTVRCGNTQIDVTVEQDYVVITEFDFDKPIKIKITKTDWDELNQFIISQFSDKVKNEW